MRAAASLVLFFVASVQAQQVDVPRAQAPPLGHRVVLVASSLGGTALALVGGPLAVVATAPVVYGTGYALGYDAPFGRVVVDGAIGVAAGYVTYQGIRYAVFATNGGALDLSQDLGAAALGLAVSAVVTPLLYEADVPAGDAVPIVWLLPDGSRAAGLSLRVRL